MEWIPVALTVLLVLVDSLLSSDQPQRGIPDQYVLAMTGEQDKNIDFPVDPGSDKNRTPPPDLIDPWLLAWDQPTSPDLDNVVLMEARIISQDPNNLLRLPTVIQLSFSYDGQSIVFNLTRNDNIRTDITVYTKGGMLKDSSEHQEYAFYFDVTYQSSVLVEKITNEVTNSATFLYSGSFFLKGDEYGFEPVVQPLGSKRRRRRSVRPSVVRRVRRQTKRDEIYQIVYQKPKISSDPVEMRYEPYLKDRFNDTSPIDLQPDSVGSKAAYTVEILGVIDYRIYSRWYSISTFSSNNQRMSDALSNIRFYFGHVFNGVDMRYRLISDPQFSISTILVGLYIATRPDEAPFVENNRQDGYPLGSLQAYSVLDNFASWLRTNQGILPAHDQASLFTSEIMIGSSGDRISGLAIIGGICSNYSVAMSRDLGLYSAIATGAHELGHNLGALHDGDNNSCIPADLYIMSAFPGLLTDTTYKNAFQFSPCSIKFFRDFLGRLAASPRLADHCLLDNHNVTFNLTTVIGQQPGQRYDPDRQCVIMYGLGSYYCGGKSEDANICRTMECYHPQYRYCYAIFEQRAFDGTTCGNKMWCQMGDCVYNSAAPSAPAECTYGDYIGPYTNGLSCAIIATSAQWNCYDPYYFDDCCASCPAVRNNSRTGCEYGDHSGTCLTMPLFNCYNSSINESCCNRCKNPGNITGCEYGDRADWCKDLIQTSVNCYAYGATCCQTCRPYTTGIATCSYGDRATWCQSLSRPYCYSAESDCCSTCPKMKNANAVGCEYGDRADWCSNILSYQCYADEYTCCSSCVKFRLNISDCAYGDYLQTCSNNMQPHLCYSWSNYCCVTCPQYYTGIPGCEYGDQEAGCTLSDCSDPYRRNICCSTCRVTTRTSLSRSFTLPVIMSTPSSTTTTTTTTMTTSTAIRRTPLSTSTTELPTTSSTTTATTVRITMPSTTTSQSSTLTTATSTSSSTSFSRPSTASSSTTTTTLAPTSTSTMSTTSTTSTTPTVTPIIITNSPTDYLETTAVCTVGDDKASYCSTMPARNCYVLADTCCETCRESYMRLNGCEYGNRVGWCEGYISNRSDCLRDGNGFWCCSTCATTYNVMCNDTVRGCDKIRPLDCYNSDYQANYCCATCRAYRKGNRAGCDYGDRVPWCGNYSRDYICASYSTDCCRTCQGWQPNGS